MRSRRVPSLPLPSMAAALGMALAVGSCGGGSKAPPPAERQAVVSGQKTPAKPEDRPESDSWTRSRQCAEQAERVAKREEQSSDTFIVIMGWSNHYSPKFQRCFVQVTYLNKDAKANPKLKLIMHSLFDAFENREIASYTDASTPDAAGACAVLEGVESMFDCAAARRFVKERMSN